MIRIIDKKDCCGCTACESICSTGAITMDCDEVGFRFPHVDTLKCVNCGFCEKVCPIINKNKLTKPISSYVAVANNNEEQLSSTSGGLASVFARYILTEQYGVVYGCSGIDCHHVKHIRVTSVTDLHLLKGSKYVQSDVSGILKQIKDDLRDNKVVLFIGTPCQNAGVRKYLRKDYDNLYCIDFVCHGVPSQKMLTDHISGLKLSQPINKVGFRYKKKGKISEYRLLLADKQGKMIYNKPYGEDYYMSGFILGLFYRDNCYVCKFAKQQRIGDITVGDYWDKDNEYISLKNSRDGLSQMHINTEKGKHLVERLSGNINYKSIDIEKLLIHSLQLKEPMLRHVNNQIFMERYPKVGFEEACKIAMSDNYKVFKKQHLVDLLFFIPGSYQLYKIIKDRL